MSCNLTKMQLIIGKDLGNHNRNGVKMGYKPLTVSEINTLASRILASEPFLQQVTVVGDVSGLKVHGPTGHIYFNLTDGVSTVACCMFKSYAAKMKVVPEDGQQVKVVASGEIYSKSGRYQLKVFSMEPMGISDQRELFNLMKEKLMKEGLFDPSHKKPIPQFAKSVGIVTSSSGAALHDICQAIRKRNEIMDIYLFPAVVQGSESAKSVARAIQIANAYFKDKVDVLIVGRGGGSASELSSFDEEQVARAVFESEIPIISAVGHEVDYSICDLVADARAMTPTDAGVMVAFDVMEHKRTVNQLMERSTELFKRYFTRKEEQVNLMMERARFRYEKKLMDVEHQLNRLKVLFEENSPQKVLNKGYSVINDEGGPVKDPRQLVEGCQYSLIFAEGKAKAVLSHIKVEE